MRLYLTIINVFISLDETGQSSQILLHNFLSKKKRRRVGIQSMGDDKDTALIILVIVSSNARAQLGIIHSKSRI